MGKEIERKFIVGGTIPASITILGKELITQMYLPSSEEYEDRVRMSVNEVKNKIVFTRTRKSFGTLERDEHERRIDATEYFEAIRGVTTKPLVKMRTTYYHEKMMISVDEYVDYTFEIAEVEFETVEHALSYKPLPWMGEEVTEDKFFKNSNLFDLLRT